ncbi:DUF6580 family putative transport protein [Flavisolibacter ginsenosidimutans]|uniref:Uncharacterized protein n=1 Tax=Flavisolibacter ginsenosidimutans TaxID=661481 RepID=A0A5B8UHD0_9BACT|nr:DUF6580 family putative transport protein [Flavisolibacter ginsenosidimutans]QEC55755.1 hypothetical protein FSB75_07575 [Flavisolibacter ginsenosidimutans]
MKGNKSLLLTFGLLILAASLYRVWPGRPYGFAPQMAMALFGGAVTKDRRLAFLLPLLSMVLSDVLYQVLYVKGITQIQGVYDGQWLNYLLIAGLTAFGFLLKKITVLRVAAFSITGSIIFFLASNFEVWAGGGGLQRPKTFDGLLMCYYDGLAFLRDYGLIKGFYGNIFLGDLFFCTLLFGSFYLLQRMVLQPKRQLA